mmetsp:Transcript_43379/g.114245  ORF Transcript_43379/g.114245 Transcript_43379/m.114245 type:complete len:464 (+) Transcript_43379:1581-2972(+)
MEEPDTVLQGLLEGALPRSLQVRKHSLVGHVQESLRLVVGSCVEKQINGRGTTLFPVWHEHDHRLLGGIMLDRLVHWTAHGKQPSGAVVNVETLNHHLKRHRTHVGREVEEPGGGADPLSDILRIRERCRQGHDPNGLLHLHRDVTHTADDGLQRGTDVAVQQVEFINDEEANLLHALPRLPPSTHQVPLVRRRDDYVGFVKDLHIVLPDKLGHLESQDPPKLVGPLSEAFLGGCLVRSDIHTTLHRIVTRQHPQHRKLGTHSLSTGCWCADQAIVIRGIERAERLRLNRVENLQALRSIQPLRIGIPKSGERQRLQVEQLGVRRILLGQNKMTEGDGQRSLRIDPTIRDDSNEVLWWQWLRDRHREVQRLLLLCLAFLQHEHLVVQDLLAVDVLYKDPEGFRVPVDAGIPLEIWSNGQLHHQTRSCDRLHVRAKIELGKLMDQFVDRLAHSREPDELTDLGT